MEIEPTAEPQGDFGDGLGIAIIGMAARFPGASDVGAFWESLRAGRELIRFFSDDELRAAGVPQADLDNPAYVKAAPVLDGIDLFDAPFFDCSPAEANFMDPQQRLLLECAWQALEDAGYTGERGSDLIGVYAGIKMNTYVADFFANAQHFGPEDRMQIMIGNGDFSLSTRISYKLNLKGPSYMLQTACSTSLAAVHLACQALLLDECRMALAGAVALEIPHTVGYHYQEGGPASPDGHCRPFDAQAQGTVFGSGVGMVLLKRLADALEDGDQIYAVIRGTAVNNDGALKASFTAPSVEGQTKVIMEALACANVDADSISYVEAHGTATPLGDPIEIQALTNAFRASTARRGFCRLGSVKGNVGHLDAAAGLAGLIKTALALKHAQIPPSLHYQRPNPEIDFASSPFVVNTALAEWPRGNTPRRAGVSSFGFGGTNTHVILEEPPARRRSGPGRPRQLLLLSAKSAAALDAATANLAAHLRAHPDADLADVAYTLTAGRPAFRHRRALVCADAAEAAAALADPADPRLLTGVQETGERPVAFLLPGQGAQHPGMGRELYQHEPVFRAAVDRCAAILLPVLGLDIRPLMFEADQRPTTNDHRPSHVERTTGSDPQLLNSTQYAQPALFVLEYALAQLWASWGVTPRAMLGHSLGEYVAATLAGVFTLEDALALVAERGRLMQSLPPGAMLSVALPEPELLTLLGPGLDLAAVNGPGRCVVAGPPEAVAALERELAAREVSCRRLHTSHAFHSAMMEPVLAPFLARLRRVRFSPPQIPYLSNVSGTWISAEQATSPEYWARHLRAPVRFGAGLAALAQEQDLALLEVGPGQTLGALARRALVGPQRPPVLASLPEPKDDRSALAAALGALGALWLAGVKPDWAGFYAGQQRQRVSLPTYPFERRRYWYDAPRRAAPEQPASQPAGRRPEIADWFYTPSWRRAPLPEAADTPRRWLLFLDQGGLGARLAERLRQAGHAVCLVQPGPQFARLGPRAFALNPARRDDYDALVAELIAADQLPEALLHLWSVTPDPALERLEQAQERGFSSLLWLCQALGRRDFSGPLQMLVVASGLHDVTGGEPLRPQHATLLGPVRVIPLEYPGITCRAIDILPADGDLPERALDMLLAEVAAPADDQVVAHRGPHRWVQSFEPMRLAAPAPERVRLRQGGVYLITGGLGGLGLAVAEHLARTRRARLVLTARTRLPAPAEWSAWLEQHPEPDRTSRHIRAVQALEQAGAEVLVLQADVADLAQMRSALESARQRFGALHGVIHAAGVPGGGIIQLKTPEQAAAVLAPKVQGALVLRELLQHTPLDFLVLCSSLSAVVGEFGQVDYCAANAFLDALAHHEAAAGRPVLTLNWDMWREVGMTVHTSVPAMLKDWREQQLQLAMRSSEGVEVLLRALAQRAQPQIMVCTSAIQTKIEQFRALTRTRIMGAVEQLAQPGAAESAARHPRPNLRTPYLAPRNDTERRLSQIWQGVLGLERIGIQDSFFELGGDSLIGLKLIAQLKHEFGIEIPPVDLYKGPTIGRLAEIIGQKSGQSGPDDRARQSGQSRGAQRRERRLQQKQTDETRGGAA